MHWVKGSNQQLSGTRRKQTLY